MMKKSIATLATVLLVWTTTAEAKTAPESFADLATKLLPSVVNISTAQTIEGPQGPTMPQLGLWLRDSRFMTVLL